MRQGYIARAYAQALQLAEDRLKRSRVVAVCWVSVGAVSGFLFDGFVGVWMAASCMFLSLLWVFFACIDIGDIRAWRRRVEEADEPR